MPQDIINKDGFTVEELITELQKMNPKAHVNALGKNDSICIISNYGDWIELGDARDL